MSARPSKHGRGRPRGRASGQGAHGRGPLPPRRRPAVPFGYAAAPVPADYEGEEPGRDFTLGRRRAASGSAPVPSSGSAAAWASAADDDTEDDDAYDQYAENRLRAVGD